MLQANHDRSKRQPGNLPPEKASTLLKDRPVKIPVIKDHFQKITDDILLSGYTPAVVVVNAYGEEIQAEGQENEETTVLYTGKADW